MYVAIASFVVPLLLLLLLQFVQNSMQAVILCDIVRYCVAVGVRASRVVAAARGVLSLTR